MTIEKIKQLNEIKEKLSEFEQGFVSDNSARVEKWGDETLFSEKQINLIDRIYQERIVQCKPVKASA